MRTVCNHLLHSEHVSEFMHTHPHTHRTIEALCKCVKGAAQTAVCDGYTEACRKEATRRGLVSGRLMQPQFSYTHSISPAQDVTHISLHSGQIQQLTVGGQTHTFTEYTQHIWLNG